MTAARPKRRDVLRGSIALLAAPALSRASQADGGARIVVIGGGFGGASAARAVKKLIPDAQVTLIEQNSTFVSCPFSNAVIAGLREMATLQFGYEGVKQAGVAVVTAAAINIDSEGKKIALSNSDRIPYDRLILAPGIDIDFDVLPGYDASATERLPHAWKAGSQTALLRRQLEAMPDGGVVVMSVPPNPYRCPPGPYERASLIAWYLKTKKPRSKLLLLDAKDVFSKQKLFQQAWAALYPGIVEWVGLSGGGKVTSVDPATLTFETEFGSHKADVGNVVPPQRAGRIAALAGVSDKNGWCAVDPVTFESKLKPGIHVIGDAAMMGAMPKSAFAANAQAKVCAEAVVRLLKGQPAMEPRLINTCYSVVAPDYGISVAGVYRPANGVLADIEGAGGTSPLDAPAETRMLEAAYAESWYSTITSEAFG